MSLLVAVKGWGARQTTKQLTRAAPGAQLRGWCVHAVGGNSGTATLTANRCESMSLSKTQSQLNFEKELLEELSGLTNRANSDAE